MQKCVNQFASATVSLEPVRAICSLDVIKYARLPQHIQYYLYSYHEMLRKRDPSL